MEFRISFENVLIHNNGTITNKPITCASLMVILLGTVTFWTLVSNIIKTLFRALNAFACA